MHYPYLKGLENKFSLNIYEIPGVEFRTGVRFLNDLNEYKKKKLNS